MSMSEKVKFRKVLQEERGAKMKFFLCYKSYWFADKNFTTFGQKNFSEKKSPGLFSSSICGANRPMFNENKPQLNGEKSRGCLKLKWRNPNRKWEKMRESERKREKARESERKWEKVREERKWDATEKQDQSGHFVWMERLMHVQSLWHFLCHY